MARITLPEEGIETLFGSYDENLKYLESLWGVKVRTQGHDCSWTARLRPWRKWNASSASSARSCADGYKIAQRRREDRRAAPLERSHDRSSRLFPEEFADAVRQEAHRAEDRQPAPVSGRDRAATTSCSASARPARARPISPWRRPSRFCSRRGQPHHPRAAGGGGR